MIKGAIHMCFIFFVVIITLSCSNSRNRCDFSYSVNLLDSIDLDRIKGLTDLSVNWRGGVLLFEIQDKKDALSIPFYIKEKNKQLILKKGKKWIYLDSLQSPKVTILDSIYLQKDRIEYYYFLMNKYPLKKIQYSARMKTIWVDIDTFSFINVDVPPILIKNELRQLHDNWWIYN